MSRMHQVLLLSSLLALAGAASADTLLVQRAPAADPIPARGLTMAQVESRFGAPVEKLDARGGQKRQWPTINRWRYANFIVYFEKSRVIDVVTIQATPTEAGPKPPIR